jgi:spermidine synthase
MIRLLSYFWPQVVEKQISAQNGAITVYHRGGHYVLSVGGLTQSGGILDSLWKSVARQLPSPKHVLILGLGGGSAARAFHQAWPQATIVGVDIDPVMIQLGKKYLGLAQIKSLTTVKADVFEWLPKAGRTFDVIVIDMYHGKQVPSEAETASFLTIVNSHIAIGGVVVFNRVLLPESKARVKKFEKLLKKTYGSVQVLKTSFNLVLACYYHG